MRIAGLVHPADLDRHLREVGRLEWPFRHGFFNSQHVLLADRANHLNRIELNNCRERRRAGHAHQTANRHLMGGHLTIERRGDPRIAQVDRRLRHAGLQIGEVRLIAVTRGPRLIHRRLRGEVALAKRGLPIELDLRLRELCLQSRPTMPAPAADGPRKAPAR